MPKKITTTADRDAVEARAPSSRSPRATAAAKPKPALVVSMSPDFTAATVWLGAAGQAAPSLTGSLPDDGARSKRRTRRRTDGG